MESIDLAPTIVHSVAEYENVRPADLPPVEAWIPLDVRHRLADDQGDRTESLYFTYLWYQVTIHPSDEVAVVP